MLVVPWLWPLRVAKINIPFMDTLIDRCAAELDLGLRWEGSLATV